MKKIINRISLQGRLYDHSLEVKTVKNQNSENFGKEFISGSIDIATDEEGLNVVTVHYTYVPTAYKSGTENKTFGVLKNLIATGKTIQSDGFENATFIKLDPAIALNDFYTDRNGEETLVSAKRAEGGFASVIKSLDNKDEARNQFELDFLITGVRLVEADPERNISENYAVVKGATFDFRGALLPMEFVVRKPEGIAYFESLDASPSNVTFTKLYGKITSRNEITTVTEEAAFGEPIVRERKRNVREWEITKAAGIPYEYGEDTVLTDAEVQKAAADRNLHLAEVKKQNDEYKAAKVVQTTTSTVAPTSTVPTGNFDFL